MKIRFGFGIFSTKVTGQVWYFFSALVVRGHQLSTAQTLLLPRGPFFWRHHFREMFFRSVSKLFRLWKPRLLVRFPFVYLQAIAGFEALVTKIALKTVFLLTWSFQASPGLFSFSDISFYAIKFCFLFMFLLRVEGLAFFFCPGTTGV